MEIGFIKKGKRSILESEKDIFTPICTKDIRSKTAKVYGTIRDNLKEALGPNTYEADEQVDQIINQIKNEEMILGNPNTPETRKLNRKKDL